MPDSTFPPPTINRWVRYHTVSTEALIEELRWWADSLEKLSVAGQTIQHHPAQFDGEEG